MIERQADLKEIAREIIGERGHWIEAYGDPAGDGRQKYRVFDPDGVLITTRFGKEAAEAVVEQLISTGQYTA